MVDIQPPDSESLSFHSLEARESSSSTGREQPVAHPNTDLSIARSGPHNRPKNEDDFRAGKFADVKDLVQWFPQIRHEETSTQWRIWASRRSRALLIQIVLIFVIFISNLTLTCFAISHFDSQEGVGLIHEGDCTTISNLNRYVHLLINFLSTGMLSASNYCMQLQAAPTRANVQKTHDQGKWMDIGVPSLRNLGYISGWRKFAWGLLALSSLPIHLLYNSAVFQSLTSFDYNVAVVKDSFVNGSSWDLATADENRSGDPGWNETRVNPSGNYTQIIYDMQTAAMNGDYLYKNISDCFDIYNDYFTPQGNVLVLVKNQSIQTQSSSSLLLYVGIMPRSDDWAKNMWALENGTSRFILTPPPEPVTTWFIGKPHYEVDHCLVQQPALTSEICRFEYSPWIMYIVCSFNLVKAIVMSVIWATRKWQEPQRQGDDSQILYTLGDAISSFIRNPDMTTTGLCLATKHDFLSKRSWRNRLVKTKTPPAKTPKTWTDSPTRWRQAASWKRWVTLLLM